MILAARVGSEAISFTSIRYYLSWQIIVIFQKLYPGVKGLMSCQRDELSDADVSVNWLRPVEPLA